MVDKIKALSAKLPYPVLQDIQKDVEREFSIVWEMGMAQVEREILQSPESPEEADLEGTGRLTTGS